MNWWRLALHHVPKHRYKGFNSLVILGALWIWKHRNCCIFEGLANFSSIVQDIRDEAKLWCMVIKKSCGVWRELKGSVAYGHDYFVSPWYYLVFVFFFVLLVMPF
jgi:hypothetical protein